MSQTLGRTRPTATPAPDRALLVVLGSSALAVLIIAAFLSGALDALVIGDPGALTRYGSPIARLVQDLSAAATLGLLAVAAFLVPEATGTDRRGTAARWAAGSALVWAIATFVGMLMAFSTGSGTPLTDPDYREQLMTYLWQLEITRLPLIASGLVVLVGIVAALVRSRAGLAWAFALGLVALWPVALGGHSAASTDHDQAVNSLYVHLVGAAVWVGGLLAIGVLRRPLGKALPVTVARFSTVALWCFIAVAASGVVNALSRLGSPQDVLTPYGYLLIGKVVTLLLLGFAGYRQRTRVVGRLAEDPGSRSLFARLVIGELLVMGAASGLAVALSRTPPPVPLEINPNAGPVYELTGYPAPPPLEASSWLTVWQPNALYLAIAALAIGLYLAGYVRMRRRGDHWPLLRVVLWVLGWLVLMYTISAAPGVYGRVMFSMHMVMHMSLMMMVPILLVLAAPVTLALRTLPARRDRTLGPRELILGVVHSRVMGVLGNPVVAGVLFFGSLVGFYWSEALRLALESHTGHVLMILHFLGVGYLFVWSLVGVDPGPPKWPAPLRLLVLFATLAAHAFFGLAMMTGTWLLAPEFFKQMQLPYVPNLLADQQLGGAIAWGIGEVPTAILAVLVVVDWIKRDEREAKRTDRRADRDGDAELAAYNARLARMSGKPGTSASGKGEDEDA